MNWPRRGSLRTGIQVLDRELTRMVVFGSSSRLLPRHCCNRIRRVGRSQSDDLPRNHRPEALPVSFVLRHTFGPPHNDRCFGRVISDVFDAQLTGLTFQLPKVHRSSLIESTFSLAALNLSDCGHDRGEQCEERDDGRGCGNEV